MTDKLISVVRKSFAKIFANMVWAMSLVWKNHPRLSWGILIVQASQIVLPASLALSSRSLINAVSDAINHSSGLSTTVLFWLAVNLGIASVNAIFAFIGQYINQRLTDDLNLKLTTEIMDHASNLEYGYFEDPRFQDVMDRAQKSMASHLTQFTLLMLSAITGGLQLLSLIAILIVIDPLVAPAIVILIFPYLFAQLRLTYDRYTLDYDRTTKRRWTGYFVSNFTTIGRIAEVRLLGLGPLMKRRFLDIMVGFKDQDKVLHRRDLRINTVFSLLISVIFFIILLRVGSRVIGGGATIGDFTIFIGAVATIRILLKGLVNDSSKVIGQALYVEDLRQFLKIEPRPTTNDTVSSKSEISSHAGKITFENVSFRYPRTKKLVLKNVSFEIKPGETVALVGENGSGKSTIVKLIARLYEPTNGRILFNGQDIQTLSIEEYYKNIAFMLQSFNRYEATVRENIAYGSWDTLHNDPNAIEEIISKLAMQDFIDTLPEGYDTLLGRKFGKYDLSGGQWQKIAIARAFARKTPLLVLDEPTSSLDVRTEYRLFNRFKQLTENQTVVLISHRFSTVNQADEILVIDAGKIIERGTHQELMQIGGQYSRLYTMAQSSSKGLSETVLRENQ